MFYLVYIYDIIIIYAMCISKIKYIIIVIYMVYICKNKIWNKNTIDNEIQNLNMIELEDCGNNEGSWTVVALYSPI